MRKLFIISFAFLFIAIDAFADVVPSSKARQVAANLFGPTTKGGTDLALVWDGSDLSGTKSSSAEAAPFYVFNNASGGFVIVSGDDDVQPILGYSFDNSFSADNMPENLIFWMTKYKDLVEDTRNGKVQPGRNVKLAWEEALTQTKAGAGTPVIDLSTALWNQGAPFYNKCPMDGSSRSLTGCVATATAIVMRYHQFPDKGVGTLEGYTTSKKGIVVPSKDLSTSAGYNWSEMPTGKYDSSSWTTTNKDEISTLMSDCGLGLQADYRSNGTSASTSDIVGFLQNHMKYSREAKYVNLVDYKISAWLSILKEELSSKHPIIYRGDDRINGDGHCFVVDGYDSNDFLKFNWGWGGSYNGYFYLTEMDYSIDEAAIIGLKPDESWKEGTFATFSFFENTTKNVYGIEADAVITKGKATKLSFCLYNNGLTNHSGPIRILHTNSQGVAKEKLCEISNFSLSGHSIITYQDISVTLQETIEEGDEIRFAFQRGSEWVTIDTGKISYVPLTYKLESIIKLTYNRSSNQIELRGLRGLTYSFNGASGTFSCRKLVLNCPSAGNTKTLTISNGKETLSVDLTF